MIQHLSNGGHYGERNKNGTNNILETKTIKSSLCDYSDVYIPVTGDITTTSCDENNNVAFKTCAPFTKFITHINDEHADTAKYWHCNAYVQFD